MNNTNVSPAVKVKSLMVQMVYCRALSVAAELGIADELENGALSIEVLSRKLNQDQEALSRLIRVLASHGIFEMNNGLVFNTETSEFLRTDAPGSQRNFARMMGSSWMWKVFNNLEHSVSTGRSAFGESFLGSDNLFLYFNQVNPEAGKVFSQAMSGFSYTFDQPIIDAYDFSQFTTITDLGGAEGRLLKLIKEKNPDSIATLFELPHAIQQAKSNDPEHLLNYVNGDFKDKVSPPSDCFIIKYCLHNWDDENTISILKNIKNAMKPGSKLLIIDMLIENAEPQVFEKSLDIVMLLLLGAKERTRSEFEDVINAAGLKLTNVISTKSPLSILEVELA